MAFQRAILPAVLSWADKLDVYKRQIQVAVRLLLRIDLLCQGRLFTSVVRYNGYVLLRVGSCDAHREGKHDDYFFHSTLDFSGK